VAGGGRRGAFNMHGSLLPKYRGRAPVNWAVLMGEAETGATLHEMVAKPDAGRIVDRERVPIGEDETAAEVFRKVTAARRRSCAVLASPGGGRSGVEEQDLARGSYFGARRPEDGPHRLVEERARDPQPRARGGAAVSRAFTMT
jgi:methionyl-tRNA formyltransferase